LTLQGQPISKGDIQCEANWPFWRLSSGPPRLLRLPKTRLAPWRMRQRAMDTQSGWLSSGLLQRLWAQC
jgi:hypothetical protein